MRTNDKLVEAVQNAVVKNQVGDLEICFEYESQEEIAHIEIYKDGKNRPLDVFTYDDMTVENISKGYPQFFDYPNK
jgi:hypothetical protein